MKELVLMFGVILYATAATPEVSDMVKGELALRWPDAEIVDVRPAHDDPRCATSDLHHMQVDMAFTAHGGRGFVCCRLDYPRKCWISSYEVR